MSFTVDQVSLLDVNRELVEAARLFEVDFASASYRIAEAEIEITTLDGKVWMAGHNWIEAAPIVGGDPLEAQPAVYRIGELVPDLISEALHNQPEWYLAPLSQYMQLYTEGAPVGEPVLLHRGFIQDISLKETATEQVLTIRAESVFAARNWTPLGEYTDRDQKRRSPNDRGCEYVATLVDKVIKGWLKA
jgi:hypothetical protein